MTTPEKEKEWAELNALEDKPLDLKSNKVFYYDGIRFSVNGSGGLYLENGGTDSWNNDYGSILKAIHPNIIWFFEKQNDYQGEWFAIGHNKEGEWYYNQGSFGSCSGCDQLQAISDIDEAIDFLNSLKRITHVGTSKFEAIEYLQNEKKNLWDDAGKVIDALIIIIRSGQL